VDDLVALAKERLTWCREVELTEHLRHTQSLKTLYQEIPLKRISCKTLGHVSWREGRSFEEMWPTFKGMYCLRCTLRKPAERVD
jgi:hypothetical protein